MVSRLALAPIQLDLHLALAPIHFGLSFSSATDSVWSPPHLFWHRFNQPLISSSDTQPQVEHLVGVGVMDGSFLAHAEVLYGIAGRISREAVAGAFGDSEYW